MMVSPTTCVILDTGTVLMSMFVSDGSKICLQAASALPDRLPQHRIITMALEHQSICTSIFLLVKPTEGFAQYVQAVARRQISHFSKTYKAGYTVNIPHFRVTLHQHVSAACVY